MTVKKAERQRIDAFELWCWRRLLRVPWPGEAVAYAMDKLQDRGRFFIDPGEQVYMGQVIGEHTRERDLVVNVCKTKKLTNVRAAGTDEKVMLPPPIKFSLEEALEYIQEDELVEITPKSMRIRKILLDALARKRAQE